MTELHLPKRQVRYNANANGEAQFSNGEEISNKHKKGDTLIIHTLEQMKPINCNVKLCILLTLMYFFYC